jgi:hypothetical protein
MSAYHPALRSSIPTTLSAQMPRSFVRADRFPSSRVSGGGMCYNDMEDFSGMSGSGMCGGMMPTGEFMRNMGKQGRIVYAMREQRIKNDAMKKDEEDRAYKPGGKNPFSRAVDRHRGLADEFIVDYVDDDYYDGLAKDYVRVMREKGVEGFMVNPQLSFPIPSKAKQLLSRIPDPVSSKAKQVLGLGMEGDGIFDFLDPKKNGVAKAFRPKNIAKAFQPVTKFADKTGITKFVTKTLPKTLIEKGVPMAAEFVGSKFGVGKQARALGERGAKELKKVSGLGLKKGSPEMKAHMAKLRAMRKKK